MGGTQRTHIFANWPPVYIGKESDKHWEEGEDLSLLDFRAIEYKRKGKAVADDEQLARIANAPKREFMRRGVNQHHTLEKICRGEPVRTIKLAKCLKVLEEYESEKLHHSESITLLTPYLIFIHCWITLAPRTGRSCKRWRFLLKIVQSSRGMVKTMPA